MKRRKFIGMLAGAGACLAATPAAAGGNHHFTGYPGSFGVLFDSTKCIGCRKCEAACSRVNELPPQPQPFDDLTVLDKKRRTHHDTFTVRKRRKSAELENRILYGESRRLEATWKEGRTRFTFYV